jgi:hypothetical protein
MTEDNRIACRICGRLALPETIKSNDGKCMVCVKSQEYEELKILSKVDGKHSLYNVSTFYLASKNIDYRNSILVVAQSIAEFLTENDLSKSNLLERYTQNPEHFHLSILDLTKEGALFIKNEFNNWLTNIDRWKPETSRTVIKYKKSLMKAFTKYKLNKL